MVIGQHVFRLFARQIRFQPVFLYHFGCFVVGDRRTGWIGCNTPINNIGAGRPLNRVPAEARIAIVTTILSPPQSSAGVSPALPSNASKGRRDACATLSQGESVVITSPAEVRET
jgi:hypothetical protein